MCQFKVFACGHLGNAHEDMMEQGGHQYLSVNLLRNMSPEEAESISAKTKYAVQRFERCHQAIDTAMVCQPHKQHASPNRLPPDCWNCYETREQHKAAEKYKASINADHRIDNGNSEWRKEAIEPKPVQKSASLLGDRLRPSSNKLRIVTDGLKRAKSAVEKKAFEAKMDYRYHRIAGWSTARRKGDATMYVSVQQPSKDGGSHVSPQEPKPQTKQSAESMAGRGGTKEKIQ